MKYSKNFNWFIGFDTLGPLAGQGNDKCDKVWKKGLHLFRNGNDLMFRIVYRVTDKTYYWQVGVPCKRKNSEQGK